jgi:hypothetical protein
MNWIAIFSGAAGAFCIKLLNLMELKAVAKDKRPDFDIFFWLDFFGSPVLGGFVCWAYSASDYAIKPILGLQLGASAPLLLRSFASSIQKAPQLPKDA